MLFIIAILPIIWLIIALSVIKMPGYKACGIAVLITAALAVIFYKMPVIDAFSASLEGALNALWPICVVIIAALFTYNLTLETKAMDKIKLMLSGVSADKRIVALVIGWGFGNFMEGMAGFGTAVAIPAGILVAMGYDPILTVVACLVVNSTPTAFGSVGVPTSTLALIGNVDAAVLSSNIVNIQLLLTFLSPFIMTVIMGKGFKALKGMIPFCIIASASFVIPQYLAAGFIGPELPDIIGSIVSMICMILAAVKMKRDIPEEYRNQSSEKLDLNLKDALTAWSPFILIFVILLFTSSLFTPVHNVLAAATSKVSVYTGNNPNTLSFAWIDCPGVKILIAGIIGGLIQGASAGTIFKVFLNTLKANLKTIFTICSVLAVAKIMGYCGMTSEIAAFLVVTAGTFYPFVAPLIGTVGGFVTGSGTSTSVLFGGLQAETATAIGVKPEWLLAANMLGAGVGKMISPQGIAIGAAAAGLAGRESELLTKVIKYAVIYTIIGGIICMVFA